MSKLSTLCKDFVSDCFSKKYCEMPKFDAQPMCMSFQPNSHVLAIVTIDNQVSRLFI